MTDANTSQESLQSMAARLLQPVQQGSQPDTSVTDAFLSAGSMNVQDTAAQLLEGTAADPLQPRITEPVTPQPSEGRFQADIMRETAAPFADIARQAAAGVTGAGEGIAGIPASIPLYGPDGPQIEIPEGVRNALNPILDAGIAALAGAGTIPRSSRNWRGRFGGFGRFASVSKTLCARRGGYARSVCRYPAAGYSVTCP